MHLNPVANKKRQPHVVSMWMLSKKALVSQYHEIIQHLEFTTTTEKDDVHIEDRIQTS